MRKSATLKCSSHRNSSSGSGDSRGLWRCVLFLVCILVASQLSTVTLWLRRSPSSERTLSIEMSGRDSEYPSRRKNLSRGEFQAHFFSGAPVVDLCEASILDGPGAVYSRKRATDTETFREVDFCAFEKDPRRSEFSEACTLIPPSERKFPPERTNGDEFWVVFEGQFVFGKGESDETAAAYDWYQFWIASDVHSDVVLFLDDEPILAISTQHIADGREGANVLDSKLRGVGCRRKRDEVKSDLLLGPIVEDPFLPPLVRKDWHRRVTSRRNIRLRLGHSHRVRLAYSKHSSIRDFGADADASSSSNSYQWESIVKMMESSRLQLQWEPNPFQLKVYVYDLAETYNEAIVRSNAECETHMFAAEVSVHRALLKSAARTTNGYAADLFYIPAYSSCKFLRRAFGVDPWFGKANLAAATRFVMDEYPWWQRSLGRDHVTTVTYDFGACFEYKQDKAAAKGVMSEVENMIILSSFADVSHPCFRPLMDVAIPTHVSLDRSKSLRRRSDDDAHVFNLRIRGKDSALKKKKWLAYFQGRLEWFDKDPDYSKGIRKRLFILYKDDPDIHIGEGKVKHYEDNIRDSTFCICPPGFAPWSPRIYEAVIAGCIPVIISDHVRLPFDGITLDWREFSVKILEKNVPQLGHILRSISAGQIRQKQLALKRVWATMSYHVTADMEGGVSLATTKEETSEFGAMGQILQELRFRFSSSSSSHKNTFRLPEEWL